MASSNRVALIQLVSSQTVDVNLKKTSELIDEAVGSGPGIIFLPENFAALGASHPLALGESEKHESGVIRSFLSEQARSNHCWIVAGTLPTVQRPDNSLVQRNRVRAASIVFDDMGREVARYDKIHMFDVDVKDDHQHYRESETFEPGDCLSLVDTPVGRVGLSVCYDIRFPELYRRLFAQGAEIFSIPSAFTVITGQAHFENLMKARAIENFCYTIAACQGGTHDSGRETYGHSMVVSPWGEVKGRLQKGEGVLSVELDLEEQKEIRKNMPVDRQRKNLSEFSLKLYNHDQ